jgi:predicted nucleic acid-binding protein
MDHDGLAVDALFVALAERLGEQLATKDGALASKVAKHENLAVLRLDPAR